jgi:hypothetical protein
MHSRIHQIVAFGMLLLGSLALPSHGQELLTPIQDDDLRYQFEAHNFIVDGIEQEVYLKLDSFTGKTWRFHVANPRWTAIPEASNGQARGASNAKRYELYPHNYIDQNGDPQELYIRADLVTGSTWIYRGANGTWREVSQDE